jgi:hypothetical protein
VERLHRALGVVGAVRASETTRQQQVGELRDEILEIQVVEQIARESGVAVFHQA